MSVTTPVRLWSPGIPPPAEFQRLNLSHPLVRNMPIRPGLVTDADKYQLRSLFIFNAREGVRDLADMARAESYVSDGGGTAASFTGDHIDCTVSGACANFGGTDFTWSNLTVFANQFTWSTLVEFPLAQSLSGFIGDDLWYWNGTTHFCYGRTVTYDPAGITAGWRRVTVSGAFSTGGTLKLYIDGAHVTDFSVSHAGTGDTIHGIGNMSVSINRDRGVKMRDMFMWEGCLSDEAILEHYLDPYEVLFPSVVEEMPVRKTGGAPPSGDVRPRFYHHRHHNRAA